jgi:hypothetical protein
LCEVGGRNLATLVIHSDALLEGVWRCTWRLGLCKFRAALGGRGHVRVEMHLEAMIERNWRSTCRWSICMP